MSIVEFVDYTNDNIKIINNEDIRHPYQSSFLDFTEEEEYPIEKVYYGSSELSLSNINISIDVDDYIYDDEYDSFTVYPVKINGIDKYVLKKGLFKSEEELINEIKLQNKSAEFGLSDPIFLVYILGDEYGLIMKKYEYTLYNIFDSECYELEDKLRYVDRIKIMLENLEENVKICHGEFNLNNIMVDEEDNLKLVDFRKGFFLDNNSKKYIDTENFTDCGFYLDTISEQVTFDLQNYWYEIMDIFFELKKQQRILMNVL